MRNVIRRTKYSMEALYQCAKNAQSLTTQHKTIIRFGLIVFNSGLNIFNLSAATKNRRTNHTFFLKNQDAMTNFWNRLWLYQINNDCKAYTRDVFRTQSSIYNKAFCDFHKEVRLGSKYASPYIQVSPIEIMCILIIFSVKYIFSDKRMK